MEPRTPKELRRLLMSELITALVCAYLTYMIATEGKVGWDLRLLAAGVILVAILLQGACYWYYRERSVTGRAISYPGIMRVYLVFEKLDLVLLVLYPILVIILLVSGQGKLVQPATFFGLILWAFALFEYLNYFHFTMHYSNFRARKPSPLAAELAAYKLRGG